MTVIWEGAPILSIARGITEFFYGPENFLHIMLFLEFLVIFYETLKNQLLLTINICYENQNN